jgi:plasmid stability protein
MADLLIRELGKRALDRLKARAASQGRSLQKEAKSILEEAAAALTPVEALRIAKAWHRRLGRRRFSDSATLIRRDRER